MELYDWQKVDCDRIEEAGGSALVNSEPGAGKTVEAVEMIRRLNPEKTLIVAPLSTIETAWRSTLKSQTGRELRKIGGGNKKEKAALADMIAQVPGVYITTPQWFTRADITDWQFDMAIVDEVHKLGKPGSAGQKKLSGYGAMKYEPLSERATYRIALSGTPVRSDVSRAWSINKFLWPDRNDPGDISDRAFWRWAYLRLREQTIYTNQKDQWGNPKTVKQYTGEKEPGRIFSEMPCVIQHFAREKCCHDPSHANGFLSLEEPVVMERTVTLTAQQKKAVRDMETQMVTYLASNPLVAEIPLTAQQRIRQCILAEPTVEWMEDLFTGEMTQLVTFDPDAKSPLYDVVKENLDELNGEPVVMFSDSAKYVRYVTERLNREGIAAAEYSGSKKADIKGLGADYQVLVAVISSISEGTDGLQERASTEMWLSRSLDEVDNRQGESRLDRRGNKRQVRRYQFFDDLGISEGRMSEQLMKRLAINRSTRIKV